MDFEGNLIEDEIIFNKIDKFYHVTIKGQAFKFKINDFPAKINSSESIDNINLIIFSFELQRKLILKNYEIDFNSHWISYKEIYDLCKNDLFFFYDHCIANRAYYLSTLLSIYDENMHSHNDYKELINHLKISLNNIKTNYDYFTNHGIIGDLYGSLSCTNILDDIYFKNFLVYFTKRALRRVDHFFSDDGIPLESSTSYWLLIHKMYEKICHISEKFDIHDTKYCRMKLNNFIKMVSDQRVGNRLCKIGVSADVKTNYLKKFPVTNHNINFANNIKVNIYDSGIIFINFFSDSGFRQQYLFNCQNIAGEFLNYPECLAFYHIDSKVDWCCSPGSIKKTRDYSDEYAISYKNQSIPVSKQFGYKGNNHPNLKIFNHGDNLIIVGSLHLGFGVFISREISIKKGSSQIHLSDKINRGFLTSQFLLNESSKVEIKKGQTNVNILDNTLNLSHPLRKPKLGLGYVKSDNKKTLTKTKMILFTGKKNIIGFHLSNPINNIIASVPKTMNYRGRKNKWPIKKRLVRFKRDLVVYKNIISNRIS